MAILYLFLAISTGILPDEEAPGATIIVVFLINLSITGGLLFKNIASKYIKFFQSCWDKKSKERRENAHIHNLEKLNRCYPNKLLGIKSFLYELKYKDQVQDWQRVRNWMRANGKNIEELEEEKEYQIRIDTM